MLAGDSLLFYTGMRQFHLSLPAALALSLSLLGCNSSASSPAGATPPLPPSQVSAGSPASQPDPREVQLSKSIVSLLAAQHLRSQPINDKLSRQSFKQFMESLDPGKLYLLASDVKSLKRFEDQLDDQIQSGNLWLAHAASDAFIKRLKIVETVVAKRLLAPFDFSIDESRETDSEKLTFANTEAELEERWRKVLKLETLGRVTRMADRIEPLTKSIAEAKKNLATVTEEEKEAATKKLAVLEKALAKIPTNDTERMAKAQEEMAKSYSARFTRLSDVEDLAPAASFLNAITASFDPHTLYMPPTQKENFDIQMSGRLEGIGAVLVEEDHFIGVRDIVPGGASWRQGDLESGDLILAVSQEGADAVEVGDMRINKVVKMIRGPKGTTVTLTVEKADSSVKMISIVRDVVEIEAAYAQGAILKRKGAADMGYIYLPSFYGDTGGRSPDARASAADVKKLLAIFAKRKLEGIILDVRSNGGGLLDDSRRMSGFFIEQGPIVQTKMPDGTIEVLSDDDPAVVYDGKLVVMIDQFSASASEIVAAALQDYNRAVIVGPGPTHGKGTVQALLNLSRDPSAPPLGVLKLTIQQFFRVNGASTQWKGVIPDIPFPNPYKHMETAERNLDNSVPWSQVAELKHADWNHTWKRADLLAKSEARQAKSTYFTNVDRRAELLKTRRDDTVLPLRKSDYEARLKKQQDELKALTEDEDELPSLFVVKPVQYHANKTDLGNDKAAKAKQESWNKSLARDAAIAESLNILGDMLAR